MRSIQQLSEDRGTATVETVLVLIPLAILLTMSPVLYHLWTADQLTRIDAHRRTFFQAVSPIDVTVNRSPEAVQTWRADRRNLNMRAYPNSAVLGRAQRTVTMTGVLSGTKVLNREALTIRPSWTWSGYPFVWTQSGDTIGFRQATTIDESSAVQTFYEDRKIDDRVVDSLFLGNWD